MDREDKKAVCGFQPTQTKKIMSATYCKEVVVQKTLLGGIVIISGGELIGLPDGRQVTRKDFEERKLRLYEKSPGGVRVIYHQGS